MPKLYGSIIINPVSDSRCWSRPMSGCKVWVTCGSTDKGDKIRFVATVTHSGNDPKFRFGAGLPSLRT